MDYFGYLNLLNGDRYFNIPLQSKDKVIKLLSEKLNLAQAEELYNALHIEIWAEYKYWFNDNDIKDEIDAALIKKHFKLDYFNLLTYQTVLNKLDRGLIEPDEFNSFIIPIYSCILQHVYDKWKSINKNACELKIQDTFMIPSWFEDILPLFSGVGRDKFTNHYKDHQDAIEYRKVNKVESYIYKIKLKKYIYDIYIQKKLLIMHFDVKTNSNHESEIIINDELIKIILQILNDAFSPKGLFYLLSLYCYCDKHGRQNKIDTTLKDYIEQGLFLGEKGQVKQKTKQDIVRMLKIFSIIRISNTPNTKKYERYRRRPVGFYHLEKLFITKSITTSTFTLRHYFPYGHLKSEGNYYLLPTTLCKESFVTLGLKFYLLIYFIIQWSELKNHTKNYRLIDLIKMCNIENYGISTTCVKDEYYDDVIEYNDRQLKLLLKTIHYMKSTGYVGDWIYVTNTGKVLYNKSEISKRKQWMDDSIVIQPPNWFERFTYEIKNNKLKFTSNPIPQKVITGKTIRDHRKSMNMTQKEYAPLLGITPEYLSQLEKGKRPISKEMQKRFIELMNKK